MLYSWHIAALYQCIRAGVIHLTALDDFNHFADIFHHMVGCLIQFTGFVTGCSVKDGEIRLLHGTEIIDTVSDHYYGIIPRTGGQPQSGP